MNRIIPANRKASCGLGGLATALVVVWSAGCSSSGVTGSPSSLASRPTQAQPSSTAMHASFSSTAPYLSLHNSTRAALLPDGRVLVLDGPINPNFDQASMNAEVYDPETNTFSETSSLLPGGVAEVTAPLHDGRVLVLGASPNSAAETYDPATGQFSLTGPMVDPNRAAEIDSTGSTSGLYTATTLMDGRVLIVGGVHWSPADGSHVYLRSAELFDPATGKFTPTGSLLTARASHTATLLPDGRVVIVGGDHGIRDASFVATAEIYDPATGQFKPAGGLITPRSQHTASLLQDGRVLIVGGVAADPERYLNMGLTSAEIYDPATGRSVATGSLAEGRSMHVACVLRDGKVLITGGNIDDAVGTPSETAELYDPATGVFIETGKPVADLPYAAVLLPDGRVFLAQQGAAAQLYSP